MSTNKPPGALTLPARHEPSGWLCEAVNTAVRRYSALPLVLRSRGEVVIGLHPTLPGSREDRTCDRCREFQPASADFYSFVVHPQPGLVLVIGLCEKCMLLEGARP